ncbi:hypothetical protein [Gordonia sp. DT101]|uniref:hypothetical protein n=1 Tax=Gordonia sp. DT101 TaxID=3416545 RepID=UPI003CED0EC7
MTQTVDREAGMAVLEQLMDERWTCTPSWCDTQPWHTVITQGDGTARLREALLAHVDTDAPVNTFRTTRADLDEAVSFVSE